MPNFLPLLLATLLILVSWHFQTTYMLANYKRFKTVSHMYKRLQWRGSFAVGLVLTGILQAAFALSLSFETQTPGLDLGRMVFIMGGMGAILLGIFSLNENYPIHEFASFLYFLGLAIGALLITLQPSIPAAVQVASIIIVEVWVASILYELKRWHGMFAIETIHVLLSYVWIVLIALTAAVYTFKI